MTVSVTHRSTRDVSLDALRGIMILILTVDHMDGVIRDVTWQTFGFVSALPGFLFISGYIVAKAYGGVAIRAGYRAATIKIIHRIARIYGWHVFSVIAATAVGFIAFQMLYSGEGRVFNFRAPFMVLTLQELYGHFNILPIYMLLLAVSPLLLIIGRHSPMAVATIGLCLWAASDVVPAAFHPWGETALLKPINWQVLYLLGMACGLRSLAGAPVRPHPWIIWGALGIAALCFALRWHLIDADTIHIPASLFERNFLAVGRLVNILCVILLFSLIMPYLKKGLERAPALIMVGQHSLAAFSLQIVILYILSLVRRVIMPEDMASWAHTAVLFSFDILSIVAVIAATYGAVRVLPRLQSRAPLLPKPT